MLFDKFNVSLIKPKTANDSGIITNKFFFTVRQDPDYLFWRYPVETMNVSNIQVYFFNNIQWNISVFVISDTAYKINFQPCLIGLIGYI